MLTVQYWVVWDEQRRLEMELRGFALLQRSFTPAPCLRAVQGLRGQRNTWAEFINEPKGNPIQGLVTHWHRGAESLQPPRSTWSEMCKSWFTWSWIYLDFSCYCTEIQARCFG